MYGRVPPQLLLDLNITPFLFTDKHGKTMCYFDIYKTMPGLPQSGILSQRKLISHLQLGGFYQTDTPMLFRHDTRDIGFTLVVDDFGIKYQDRKDFGYLSSHLEKLYTIKAYPIATSFLGYTIQHDRSIARTITLSIPKTIRRSSHESDPRG